MSTELNSGSFENTVRDGEIWRRGNDGTQMIPINMFRTEHGVMLVTPMPGMEPDSIEVEVDDNRITIQADLRGPGQERRDYLMREWHYGPYCRSIDLPGPVDINRANASYHNGILTIELPSSGRSTGGRLQVQKVGTIQGMHAGHSGHDMRGPNDARR